MKAAIVVHSQSGNTAAFAADISECLKARGVDTEIHLLRTVGIVKPAKKDIQFKREIDLTPYDTVFLGCPVWAFSASNVMNAFLKLIPSLKGKKAAAFITHGLPFTFMGANQALKSINETLDLMMAEVIPGETQLCLLGYNKKQGKLKAEALAARVVS